MVRKKTKQGSSLHLLVSRMCKFSFLHKLYLFSFPLTCYHYITECGDNVSLSRERNPNPPWMDFWALTKAHPSHVGWQAGSGRKGAVTNSGDLSSIPGTYKAGEKWFLQIVLRLSLAASGTGEFTCTHRHTQEIN